MTVGETLTSVKELSGTMILISLVLVFLLMALLIFEFVAVSVRRARRYRSTLEVPKKHMHGEDGVSIPSTAVCLDTVPDMETEMIEAASLRSAIAHCADGDTALDAKSLSVLVDRLVVLEQEQ